MFCLDRNPSAYEQSDYEGLKLGSLFCNDQSLLVTFSHRSNESGYLCDYPFLLMSLCGSAVLWSQRQRLFAALGQITEVIVVGLHELPDDWHREHHNKPNGGPNCNGVVAH